MRVELAASSTRLRAVMAELEVVNRAHAAAEVGVRWNLCMKRGGKVLLYGMLAWAAGGVRRERRYAWSEKGLWGSGCKRVIAWGVARVAGFARQLIFRTGRVVYRRMCGGMVAVCLWAGGYGHGSRSPAQPLSASTRRSASVCTRPKTTSSAKEAGWRQSDVLVGAALPMPPWEHAHTRTDKTNKCV